MKRLLSLFILFVLVCSSSYSQNKDKQKSGFYAGIGYSIMIYTNSDVGEIYPAFNFRVSSFNSEITPHIGYKLSDMVSIEFAPSFIHSKSGGDKGFYYQSGTTNYYYVPSPPYLFAFPLNAKLKLFPFTKSKSYIVQGLFFGVAAGPMFIREEYENYIYPDNSLSNMLNIKSVYNSFWTGNAQFSFGYSGGENVTYGVELGYRFVPLPLKRDYPLISSLASNMNSVLLNIKVGFNF
ncbi:MAG: hypothetical protein WC139_09580 [Candidatus Kapaibacterium sp.]